MRSRHQGAENVGVGSSDSPLCVNAERVLRRIEELAGIGATPEGGVTRLGFSAADREAQRYLADEARRSGLVVDVDSAGNVLMRRAHGPSTGRSVLFGLHLDTVRNGGRLDGAYGVVGALEVLERLDEAGVETALKPVAVAFSNEEGALFQQPFWGSLSLTGRIDDLPRDPRDLNGLSLREPLRLAGGDLDALETAAWPQGSIAAYLELHIEQGPVLERTGFPIGVVDSIVGRIVIDVDITGQAGHAGTTPMPGRRDALVAAGQIVQAAERLAAERQLCRVATVGRLSLQPGSTNVIPGAVSLTAELRDGSRSRLVTAEREFRGEAALIGKQTGCEVKAKASLRVDPEDADPRIRDIVATVASRLGLTHTTTPSGAGHDAQVMASAAPFGMIFVPSQDGLSHVPQEYTAPEDLVDGADVLLNSVLALTRGSAA
ncbi:Zn-dependent hydrolase [Streptomyces echinatus]|uniref:Zn-dependent hydrolase n=1 Tax=Streptomyces echinatus TaxID=67293 RepID=UPI0037AEF739